MINNNDELAQRIQQYRDTISEFRISRLFALILCFIPACAYMILHTWYFKSSLSETWVELSGLLAMVLLLITIVVCAYQSHRWRNTLAVKLKLFCPGCQHLLGEKGANETVSTGRCASCGADVD